MSISESIKKFSETLPIFHAGSLTGTFTKINTAFKNSNPEIEIVSVPAGRVAAIRKITEQKMECGVIASADYKLIIQLMFPSARFFSGTL
jgi:molybdate/tungstate transport system substrate-binding protein